MRADGPAQIKANPKIQEVTLVTNGDIAKVTFDLIKKAEKEIISMEFLLRDDEFGMMKLALLRKKAREGKKVYVHVDSFHLLVNPAIVHHLAQEGIEFSVYNDLTLKTALRFSYRNHCKFLIIDGEAFKTGDTNSGNEYVHWPHHHQMKSMDVVMKGSLTKEAREYAIEVLKSYMTSTPRFEVTTLERVEAQRERVKKMSTAMKTFLKAIQVETDGPDQITKPDCCLVTQGEIEQAKVLLDKAYEDYLRYHEDQKSFFDWEKNTLHIPNVEFFCDSVAQKGECSRVGDAVSDFLSSAQNELIVVSPYLILTPKMRTALKTALDKGVRVKLYTNSEKSTDNKTTQLAYEYRVAEIAALGNVEIYEYEGPETLHAKFLLKDQDQCMLMTYNIDWRSEIKNLETALQFRHLELSMKLQDWLDLHESKFKLVATDSRLLKQSLTEKQPNDHFTRLVIRALETHL